MTDFVYSPQVTVRQHPKFMVTSNGVQWYVNGAIAGFYAAATLLENERHFLRDALAPVMGALRSNAIAGAVTAEVDGKPAQILIDKDQFATVAAEVSRYGAWCDQVASREAQRKSDAQRFDRLFNEGGEGFNPHRDL